jgi:hypothetical protein
MRVQGSELRAKSSGFRVQGSELVLFQIKRISPFYSITHSLNHSFTHSLNNNFPPIKPHKHILR